MLNMQVKRQSNRQRLIESITRDVSFLLANNRSRSLGVVMEATGYLSNRHNHTSRQLGRAILALVEVLDAHSLKTTAGAAAFERVIDRSNAGETSGSIELANQAEDLAIGNAVEEVRS